MFRVTARTVLELGSELISSDIIAFYELIKNVFDARSRSGADIFFNIVLRRNNYLKLRALAEEPLPPGLVGSKKQEYEQVRLVDLKSRLGQGCDSTAPSERIEAFLSEMGAASTLREFVTNLDRAYSEFNTIEVTDTGSGMSLNDLSENYLTIGTPSRKREILGALASGRSKSPYLGEKGIGRLSVINQERLRRSRISASVAKCFMRSRTRLHRPTCRKSATCTPGC